MMKNIKYKIIALCLLMGAGLGLKACEPATLVVGTGAYIGTMAMEARGVEQSARDKWVATQLFTQIVNQDAAYINQLGFEVVEGRVLAVGRVENQAKLDEVLRLIWNIDGVYEVINEIEIGGDHRENDWQRAYDAKIAADLQIRLFADRDIYGVNYGFEVFNGRVFVIGIAQNQDEIDLILNHIHQIKRVKGYRLHIMLKDSQERLYWLERLKAPA